MISLVLVLISQIVLIRSADIFVDQASALAKKLRIDDFLIGFTVVAFGTSLPELMSAIFSALAGHNQLVVSSIIGSNIANLCLIFGVVAIFKNYKIKKRDVNINIPLNMAAMMIFWALLAWSGFELKWQFGVSLILIFLVLILLSKDYNHLSIPSNQKYSPFKLWLMILSLTALIISGKFCVQEIILLAKEWGVAETILGYFLLAVGTSLPELVTTWMAVSKGNGELGVGNILGSNLFNLLFALGVSSFIQPVVMKNFVGDLIFLTVALLTVYFFAVFGKKYSFSKKEGVGLLFVYFLFVIFQIVKIG